MSRETTAGGEPAVISPADLPFLQDRTSIIVATRNAEREPHLMRAIGCRVEEDGRWIVVLLARAQALALIDDVADNGRIAVIFCRPTTDRGVQIKGDDARVVTMRDDDAARLDAYREAMTDELAAIGYPPAFTRAMLSRPGGEIVAIGFTPLAAFDQSPGPGAGAPLSAGPSSARSSSAKSSSTGSSSAIPRGPAAGEPATDAPASARPIVDAAPPSMHPPARPHRLTDARSRPDLAALRHSFEGATPCVIATCSADGTPNVTYLSQFEYVDAQTAGASFQFFNKTRRNLLQTGLATLLVMDPQTAAFHRIAVGYLRTEYEGPLFERMRARLASIATHTGMAQVFKLQGADVYRVHDIEVVPGDALQRPESDVHPLSGLHRILKRLLPCQDLDALWQTALQALADELAIEHALLLIADPLRQRLYTVASLGYPASGVGSEVAYGEGVIGVCASVRVPIRLTHVTQESIYGQAILSSARQVHDVALETRIALPGLHASGSRLAVPIRDERRLIGVLYVESAREMRFTFEIEEALDIAATYLGLRMQALSGPADGGAPADPVDGSNDAAAGGTDVSSDGGDPRSGPPLRIKFFAVDGSVFVDDDYLIKGVAGAIFRALIAEYRRSGRTQFSNRELRLNPELRLPDVSDNLEARLVLLSRRLIDRGIPIRIQRTGRGRFALRVDRAPELTDIDR